MSHSLNNPAASEPQPVEPKDGQQAVGAPSSGSASDLLEQWKKAIKERDESVSQRIGNMFRGPMCIEERLLLLEADAQMNVWFLNKVIVAAAEIEAKMSNADLKNSR